MTAPKEVSMDAAPEAFLSGLGSIFTVAEEQDKQKEQFFFSLNNSLRLVPLEAGFCGRSQQPIQAGGKKSDRFTRL